MGFKLHDYYIGESFEAWKYFGAHPKDKGYVFRVYAPNAKDVAVIGEFSDWEPVPTKMLEKSGVWITEIENAKVGDLYKYRIYFEDGNYCDHADPFAFSSELRPGTASVIADLNYRFTDKKWIESRDLNYNKPMNIYEVHLGSWRTHEDGSFYTYEEIAQELIDYVKEHHYTHVEFMPLTEYPVDESWGYQVLGFYSATSRYGSPRQLQQLVNSLHKNGIGVILDFVPVHFALDYFGLARFDGSALYEYDHDVGYSQWGSHNFNYYRGEVRSFLQSAIDFWLTNYHFDGIRMDAISNIIYWQGNRDRGVNEGAIEFVQNMNEGIKKRFPTVMKIAEDSTDFVKVTAPVEYDGLGFDYKWDLGWMNDTLEFMKFDKYDRGGYIGKIEWSMFYFYNELFLLPFSHDEVVHGKGSLLNKMNGSYEERFEQLKLIYLYMMTHPGKKLNFMGNEFAHFDEWSESRELYWTLLDYPIHKDMYDYGISLNNLYINTPPLWVNDYNPADYRWWDTSRFEVLAYQRTGDKRKIITVLNFGGHDLKDVRINYNKASDLKVIFKSLNHINISDTIRTQEDGFINTDPENGGYYFLIDLPPFGGVVFEAFDDEDKVEQTAVELEKPEPKKVTKVQGKKLSKTNVKAAEKVDQPKKEKAKPKKPVKVATPKAKKIQSE